MFRFPRDEGKAGQVLETRDGSGHLFWKTLEPSTNELSSYGTVVGRSPIANIFADAAISFDMHSSMFPNRNMMLPVVGQTSSFTVLTKGDYEFNFYVCATNGNETTIPLEIGLFIGSQKANVGGTSPYIRQSNLAPQVGNCLTCSGNGFIYLEAGNVVSIRNVSATPIQFLDTESNDRGITSPAVTRVFTLKKLS